MRRNCVWNVKSPNAQEGRCGRHGQRAAARPDAVGRMTVHSLPGAAAYVGADITAGVLATGMAYRDDTCLLVDLGTNGEIVLKHNGTLLGCATAAGPAFEGAGLSYGMRASHGAIGHIWLDKDPPAAAHRSDWRHGRRLACAAPPTSISSRERGRSV